MICQEKVKNNSSKLIIFRENSFWEKIFGKNAFWEKIFLGKMLFGKCAFREKYFSGKMHFGENIFWEKCFSGKKFREKCSGKSAFGKSAFWKNSWPHQSYIWYRIFHHWWFWTFLLVLRAEPSLLRDQIWNHVDVCLQLCLILDLIWKEDIFKS